MKNLVLALSIVFSQAGFTKTCQEKLTESYSLDSRHFQYDIDQIEYESEKDFELESLKHLYRKIGCDSPEIKEKKCRNIGEYQYSYACFFETKEGSFFVIPDMIQKVNIIFNRFD